MVEVRVVLSCADDAKGSSSGCKLNTLTSYSEGYWLLFFAKLSPSFSFSWIELVFIQHQNNKSSANLDYIKNSLSSITCQVDNLFSIIDSHPVVNFNPTYIALQLWISSKWWIFITIFFLIIMIVLNFHLNKHSPDGWSSTEVMNFITIIDYHNNDEFSRNWWFFKVMNFKQNEEFLSQI